MQVLSCATEAVATMQWGRINSGQKYGVLTWDLDRAFGAAGFTRNQAYFLGQIREGSWGEANRLDKKDKNLWPEARGCQINLSELARETEVGRQQWSAAKRYLIAARVLLEDAEGWLRINKNAHEWINPRTGKPLITSGFLRCCRAVQPDAETARSQAQIEFPREHVNPRARYQKSIAVGPKGVDSPRDEPAARPVEGPTVVRPDSDAPRNETASPPASDSLRPPHQIRCIPHNEIDAVPAREVRHPGAVAIEERPRGVLDREEGKRAGREGTPPPTVSNSLSGKASPWRSTSEQRDYRSLSTARSPAAPQVAPSFLAPGWMEETMASLRSNSLLRRKLDGEP